MASTTKSPLSEISLPATPGGQIVIHFTPTFRAAMRELVKAYQLASHSHYDPWDLAVEIARLETIGITETDLRWLVRSGYVEHAREVTDLDEDGRRFRRTGNLSFAERTCFVLTATGESFARELLRGGRPVPDAVLHRPSSGNGSSHEHWPAMRDVRPSGTGDFREHPDGDENGNTNSLIPTWDRERHELRVGGQLVKHFKCAAVNQETILAAFGEEGWPPRIDDPLPPQDEQDSKRRLNDTIKCLNKNQKQKLICFHGDGTGEGVLWNLAECDETESCSPEDCPFRKGGKSA